ncbi:TVP38/TMEM64 family protein [Clostridium akagii]|uniref:TVP38/TMEM64 family protein n=1 Tax=Clostridium akagii TaxID=91623 RepID=UPI00047EF73B|nr:TVP38/TMEM64 family protein [Clostridium akagii]
MRNFFKDKLKYIGLAVLIIFVLILIFKLHPLFRNINFKHVKHYILSYGKFSSIIFIIIYSLKPIVFIIPASLLSIVAGNIFGSFYAFIYSMIGCFLSATVAFFLARSLGKPFVDKMLKGKIVKLDSSVEKHGFPIMLLMRLSFVFPYDGLSYACGLTKVKYKDFILGSILGIIPEMILYSYIGKNLGKHFIIKKLIMPIIAIILIALIAYYFYNNYKSRKAK